MRLASLGNYRATISNNTVYLYVCGPVIIHRLASYGKCQYDV